MENEETWQYGGCSTSGSCTPNPDACIIPPPGDSCVYVGACGINRRNPYANVYFPGDDGISDPCSVVEQGKFKCECKEGCVRIYPDESLAECCPSDQACVNRCCEKGEECGVKAYQQTDDSGHTITLYSTICCPQGKRCFDKDGFPFCCETGQTCDSDIKQCCPLDENGKYPPEVTEQKRKECLTVLTGKEGECITLTSSCKEEEECCNGKCCDACCGKGDTKECCEACNNENTGCCEDSKLYYPKGQENKASCCNGRVFGDNQAYCCSEVIYKFQDEYLDDVSANNVSNLESQGFKCYQYDPLDDSSYYCERNRSDDDDDIETIGTQVVSVTIPNYYENGNSKEYEICCQDYILYPKVSEDTQEITYEQADFAGGYYDGSWAQCCYGELYRTINGDQRCCNEYTGNEKIVDVIGGETLCCGYYEDEGVRKPQKGYWNGESAQCCSGEVNSNGDGTYHCCEVPNKYYLKPEKWGGNGSCFQNDGTYKLCCRCSGDTVWNSQTQQCESCPGGTVKTGCSDCTKFLQTAGSGCNVWCDPFSWTQEWCGGMDIIAWSEGYNANCYSYTSNSEGWCDGKCPTSGTSCGICPPGSSFGSCKWEDYVPEYDENGEEIWISVIRDGMEGCCDAEGWWASSY